MVTLSLWIRLLLSVFVALFVFKLERFYLLYFLVAYILAFSGLLFRQIRSSSGESLTFWLGKILDFSLVTLLLYFTGGRESPLIFLVFLPPLETALSGDSARADRVTLVALGILVYFFVLRDGTLDFTDWLYFFVYLGALGLTGFLALKFSRLHSELARQEDIQRYLLSSLSAGLVFLDPELRVLSWNPRAEEILGKLQRGQGLRELLSPEIVPVSGRGEFRHGEKILGYSLFPLRKGSRILGWGFLFQDITEARRREERLREAERLASLGTMAAGLIHEIKNPLATISGGIEFLRENLRGVEELAPILEVISRESERLNRLVNNFLFFARPERGEREEFEVRALFEEIIQANQDLFAQVEVRMRVPEVRVKANREQWRQIFENLLRNAAEASLHTGRPWVEVEMEPGRDFHRFRIRDYGPGIPSEIRARMFEPFFTTKPRGTGLGLAVVYRIVENLKGDLRVTSREGAGTVVEVRIPVEG
ncbi:nitrogen regulation protein NR(II) [Thermosulfurimonas sp. F29]|uniref:two-component system sensor histidine kinase NtrB n=1 Tax=Thermosulfurimonas sp. F29 TaxID=2867247 RepID=UPI001C8383C2|nr:ATP-binding protein [Thermosulfurimonas sp. F29]MBX6422880.1 hypothetical protein [Thermosulfurimonas sp. F29]